MDEKLFPTLTGADIYLSVFYARVTETVLDNELPAACGMSMKEGGIVFYYTDFYLSLPDEVKKECLKHEAGHWIYGTTARRGDRDFQLWSLCTDLSINETLIDKELVNQYYPICTYENKNVPVVPPEIAYDLLVKRGDKISTIGVCAHWHGMKTSDDTEESLISGTMLEMDLLSKLPEHIKNQKGASSQGSGAGVDVPITKYPNWLKRIIPLLRSTCSDASNKRARSYQRESRRNIADVVLSGKRREAGVKLQIMIDQSGSMSGTSLGLFLGAIAACPELSGSVAYCFDTEVSEPLRAEMSVLQSYLNNHAGGGTLIRKAGEILNPEIPVVWFTDGYSCDGFPDVNPSGEYWLIVSNAGMDGRKNVIYVKEEG